MRKTQEGTGGGKMVRMIQEKWEAQFLPAADVSTVASLQEKYIKKYVRSSLHSR